MLKYVYMIKTPAKVDLLIFDFDGTITDSIPAAVDAIKAMIADLGFTPKTSKEINKHVGYGEVALVSGSLGTQDPKLLKTAMEIYCKHYINEGIKKVRLYPHVKEFLEHFKNKTKIIISNKKQEFIEIILKNFCLSSYFKEILGGDTAPCLKPDPCAINDLLKKYEVKKERALFIGDMTIDVETGKNAGVLTCSATYGFEPKEKLIKSNPDFIVDDLLELIKLIA